MTPPGELPVSDDERVISLRCGPETVVHGVFPLVLDPLGAERTKGCGVGAAFGREVAAEAEHVRPGSQAQAAEFGEPAEAEAFGDKPAGVVADRKIGEPAGGCDTAGGSPTGLSSSRCRALRGIPGTH